MNRGEVWWVDFEPAVGGEIRKKRPAIVVSNDKANKYLNRLQVVPVTSKTGRLYPGEALVTVAGRPAKALTSQITTVSKLRLLNKADELADAEMDRVEAGLVIQLGLPRRR
jgi:mRNA interferase MazF